jgi:dCMP deaminase
MQEKRQRPSWDDYFFEVMHAIAKRASCDRGRSGCVIVRNKQILTTGYVGAPPGFPDCDEVGHQIERRFDIKSVEEIDRIFPRGNPHNIGFQLDPLSKEYHGIPHDHCIRTLHAEENAILQAAKLGVALEGSTLYCSMTPCRNCAMAIMRVGIKEVFCEKKYHKGQDAEEMFKMANIKLFFKSDEVQQYGENKS